MFGILQYDSSNKGIQFIRRENPTRSSSGQHSACDLCRSKKLRCSGDTAGCTRCKALSRKCSYTMACQVKERNRRGAREKSISEVQQNSPLALKNPLMTQSSDTNSGDSLRADGEQIVLASPSEPGELDVMIAGGGTAEKSLHNMQRDTDPLDEPDDLDFIVAEAEERLRLTQWGVSPFNGPLNDIMNVENTFSPESLDIITPVSFPLLQPTISTSSTSSSFLSTPTLLNTTPTTYEPESPPCNCLSTILFLLEDLDQALSALASNPLSSSLAVGKGALNSVNPLLICNMCMNRTETITLLVFVSEKLVLLDVGIMGELRGHVKSAARTPIWINTQSSLQDTYARAKVPSRGGSYAAQPEVVKIGDYEISSEREWAALLHALMALHLQALSEFLRGFGEKTRGVLPNSQYAKLDVLKEKVAILRGKICTTW